MSYELTIYSLALTKKLEIWNSSFKNKVSKLYMNSLIHYKFHFLLIRVQKVLFCDIKFQFISEK